MVTAHRGDRRPSAPAAVTGKDRPTAVTDRNTAAAQASLRLMAVHAHPDDESSKGAATMAKYAADGVGVLVVSCTGGERGDVLNPSYQMLDAHDIAVLRQQEMADAAEILGIAHEWLGFEDSGYHEGDPADWKLPPGSFADLDPESEIEALVRVVRAFRPHVMTTYDEKGGYPHPDHIRCHVVSIAAYRAAGDPNAYPDAGEPWEVSKLYYNVGFSVRRMRAIHDAALAAGLESPFTEWLERWSKSEWPDSFERATTHIPVAAYFQQRDAALKAHATQIDPDAHWFAVPYELETEVWPTEEFELADSRVPTSVPETDLFAGVRETVAA